MDKIIEMILIIGLFMISVGFLFLIFSFVFSKGVGENLRKIFKERVLFTCSSWFLKQSKLSVDFNTTNNLLKIKDYGNEILNGDFKDLEGMNRVGFIFSIHSIYYGFILLFFAAGFGFILNFFE